MGRKRDMGMTNGKKGSIGSWLLYAGAVLSLLYFVGLWAYLGAIYLFQWFWLGLGIFLAVLGRLLPRWSRFPKWFRRLWKGAVILILAAFVVGEGLIISGMVDEPAKGADYVIVLGAKVNGTTPSLSLLYRIQAAYAYLEENPNTKVVASGGQGANEGISEALAIRNTLVEMGLSEERILLEDRSTSTTENLLFSKEILRQDGGSPEESFVVIVSSDFHVFRAKAIAANCGYRQVEGKSAASVPGLQPHYCVREFFALLKDGIRGNLKIAF